ncbi:MAG TPA: MgtC/SapB family protein [Chryseosolibacter sp.]
MTSGDDLPGTRLFDTLNDERNSTPLMEENIKDILVKLGLALLIGTVIGAEREFKNKSAGLRTLILICLGSALFTMISGTLGAEGETGRIASNIVTGIGFLGAGAIMREGLTVSGLTTASSIWVTAALGMSVGAGEYYLAISGTLIVLIVLTMFGYIHTMMERYKKAIELHVTYSDWDDSMLEEEMRHFNLAFEKIRTIKKDGDSMSQYDVSGPKKRMELFLKSLNRNQSIRSFEY